MFASTVQNTSKALSSSPVSFVEDQVLNIINRDRESWTNLISTTAKGEMFIPKTSVPHIHPDNTKIPCMVCAAHSRELTTVSAVILLSLAEVRYRDEHWNADQMRRADHIVTASKGVVSDKVALSDMFGPNWGLILSLAYRIEFADAETLIGLLRKAMSTPGASTVARLDGGRDWSQPARWLISNAMSGRRSAVKSPTRIRNTADSGRLMGLASVIAINGNTEESVEEWMVSDPRKPVVSANFQPLRAVTC